MLSHVDKYFLTCAFLCVRGKMAGVGNGETHGWKFGCESGLSHTGRNNIPRLRRADKGWQQSHAQSMQALKVKFDGVGAHAVVGE